MIGIKVKNQLFAQTLKALMPEKMEIFKENTPYTAVISDENYQGTLPVLYVGKNFPNGLSFPFSLRQLEQALENLQRIKLKYFYWESAPKKLISKTSKKVFYLTQREGELIDFLCHHPSFRATKEQILEQVWHYHEKAKTHTLESHLYVLNQKLGTEARLLIKRQKDIFTII